MHTLLKLTDRCFATQTVGGQSPVRVCLLSDATAQGAPRAFGMLGLVLVIAAHGDQPAVSAEGSPESMAAGGISNAQEAELHRLLQATSEAIQELPAGHRSKDKLRLLHGKLESLRAASADAEELEWDAMVQALLDSTEYGSAQVEALLQARVGAAAPACNADGADSAVVLLRG